MRPSGSRAASVGRESRRAGDSAGASRGVPGNAGSPANRTASADRRAVVPALGEDQEAAVGEPDHRLGAAIAPPAPHRRRPRRRLRAQGRAVVAPDHDCGARTTTQSRSPVDQQPFDVAARPAACAARALLERAGSGRAARPPRRAAGSAAIMPVSLTAVASPSSTCRPERPPNRSSALSSAQPPRKCSRPTSRRAGSPASSGTGVEISSGLARPRRHRLRARRDDRRQQHAGRDQSERPAPAAAPNPFRKTPQFHERRLTDAFRPGSTDSCDIRASCRRPEPNSGTGQQTKELGPCSRKSPFPPPSPSSALTAMPAAA